jgi:hypothetical protein
MEQTDRLSSLKSIRSKVPYILAVAATFFVFELWLLANSFSADVRIYSRVAQSGFTFWGTYWVSSELIGELGLIVRFSGACFFLAFPVLLIFKSRLGLSALRKAVLLEASHYLFFLPFISYLFLHPFESFSAAMVSYEAATSYILQLAIVAPIFLKLYLQLKKPNLPPAITSRWVALAAVGFVFSLWTKHFIFALYALPINFQNSTLTIGFLNSSITMLLAAVLLSIALMPTIKSKGAPRWKLAGVAFCVLSVYFWVYLSIASVVSNYLWYLMLTELWAVSMMIAGVAFLRHKSG